MNIKNIAAFLILMQNGEGLPDKSPDYILEKYQRYCVDAGEDEWKWGLDAQNAQQLRQWHDAWQAHIPKDIPLDAFEPEADDVDY